MNAEQMQAALESAIAKRSSEHPGTWDVTIGEDYVQLIWSCPENEAPDMYGDEPWSEWGGDAILESAGLGDYAKSGCDSYQDKFGDEMVAQWVEWHISEDE